MILASTILIVLGMIFLVGITVSVLPFQLFAIPIVLFISGGVLGILGTDVDTDYGGYDVHIQEFRLENSDYSIPSCASFRLVDNEKLLWKMEPCSE